MIVTMDCKDQLNYKDVYLNNTSAKKFQIKCIFHINFFTLNN